MSVALYKTFNQHFMSTFRFHFHSITGYFLATLTAYPTPHPLLLQHFGSTSVYTKSLPYTTSSLLALPVHFRQYRKVTLHIFQLITISGPLSPTAEACLTILQLISISGPLLPTPEACLTILQLISISGPLPPIPEACPTHPVY